MSTSTDAILFWGYSWTDETSKPWTIGTEDAGDDAETDESDDWEDRYAQASGLARPQHPYPDVPRGQQPTAMQAAVMEAFKQYWEAKRKLVAASGCEVRTHCSGDCPMPYVAVMASHKLAWRGDPVEITSLDVAPEWQEQLAAFCQKLGIKTEGLKATWWLVSDWS